MSGNAASTSELGRNPLNTRQGIETDHRDKDPSHDFQGRNPLNTRQGIETLILLASCVMRVTVEIH
jgi:hypothetical protein